jgi:demethylmenaquinone methyltransferase/2-methoxy-6-polyprenyl-1,4-benzoquinol methylase
MAKSSSILMVLLVPVIAFLAQHYLFGGVDAPLSDHGSGSMFDLIANRYDMINRVLAVGMDMGWRLEMVKRIQSSVDTIESPLLLDVATGTADVALLLAKEIPSATVLGLDPSNNMLEIGRGKIQQRGQGAQVRLELADAMDFSSMKSYTYDAATMAFGIRNVPDREKALCQIHRVLKPYSRFCILEFSEPDESAGVMGAGARIFIRYVVPFLGGILSGAPREYWHLQNSIKDFPSPKEFGKLLEQVKCDESSTEGAFRLDELVQLNFGSVQLYVTTSLPSRVKPTAETTPEEIPTQESSPEETAPEEATPEETAPEETTPEETAPEEVTPMETMPGEETTPTEETMPEETTPEEQ